MPDTIKFSIIDQRSISDHYYLETGDECLYLYEYTSRKDYNYSPENNLISNLKKPTNSSSGQLYYKNSAIRRVAKEMSDALNHDWLINATLIPAPPSKTKNDPVYDNRILRICCAMGENLDVREIIIGSKGRSAFHEGERMTLDELVDHLIFDESTTDPVPKQILVVDDVLVSGTHFKAMKRMLTTRWPDVPVYGAFVARRVFPNPFEAVNL